MNHVRRMFASTLATTLVLLGTTFVETASAVVLQCGAVVTQSTTLTADVGPCDGTAIFVRGNNLVLNLNGHRVFGTPDVEEAPGIYLEGVTGVSVINGTVSNFDSGVYLEFGGSNTVRGIRAIDNVGGLHGEGIFGEGIQLFQSDNNLITGNQVLRNGTFAGIVAYDAQNTRITNNIVQANNIGQTESEHIGQSIMQDIGIWVITLGRPTTGNLVADNQVSQNGLEGIQISNFANNNLVLRNQVVGNGFGQSPGIRDGSGIRVGFQAQGNLVEANRVFGNAADGIALVNATNNSVRNNQSGGNNLGPSPTANFDLYEHISGCDNNIWANNTGTRNQQCIG